MVVARARETIVLLARRPARTLLTAAGMACGVFGLVLLAGMAEHFGALTRHFQDTFSGRVYVCEKPTFWAGGGILPEEKTDAVKAVPGVGQVIPLLIARLEARRLVVLGIPQVLVGLPPQDAQTYWRGTRLLDGRWLTADDADSRGALLGSDVAFALDARVGQKVRVLDRDFDVVGVLAHTGALEDKQMLVGLKAAQEAMDRQDLLTSMVVIPTPGLSPEALAKRIEKLRVEAIPPSRMKLDVAQSLRLWQALALAVGLLAALTGSLCIVLTMVVAVHERVPEIGIKKAIGAPSEAIVFEFLWEAAALAIVGWAAGACLAGGFVAGWNEWFRREGIFLFTVTPRVLGGSLSCAVVLGLLAAAIPAFTASRLDPVRALRRTG